MKRITDEEPKSLRLRLENFAIKTIMHEGTPNATYLSKEDVSRILRIPVGNSTIEGLVRSQKEQEQERRAIGEWLHSKRDENGFYDFDFQGFIEALKQGTLPAGIKEDG